MTSNTRIVHCKRGSQILTLSNTTKCERCNVRCLRRHNATYIDEPAKRLQSNRRETDNQLTSIGRWWWDYVSLTGHGINRGVHVHVCPETWQNTQSLKIMVLHVFIQACEESYGHELASKRTNGHEPAGNEHTGTKQRAHTDTKQASIWENTTCMYCTISMHFGAA